MTTWAICSVQYVDAHVVIKSTQEIKLGWLEAQYTEAIYPHHDASKKLFKTDMVADKGGKVGQQYPFWHYELVRTREYEIAWQIIQFLLADGWEPFSTLVFVAGEGNSAKSIITSAPEYLFRKALVS